MRRIAEIAVERMGPRRSLVMVRLRSPELARTLKGSGEKLVYAAWIIISAMILIVAWEGGMGYDAHLIVIVPVMSAAVFWATWNANRLWQNSNRTMLDDLIIELDERAVAVEGPDGSFVQPRGNVEIRFSSRPDRRGMVEHREEQRIGRPLGYAFRDAWEVWCEAGLDVIPIISVSDEEDARAIVRHLSEENLFVTRGGEQDDFRKARAAPL